MGTLVAFEWLSADGVFEADSMGDWFFPYDSLERRVYIKETYRRADALLMGRETYEMLAPGWSQMADDAQDGLAGVLTHKPKYAVSSGSEVARWGPTTLLKSDAAAEIGKLKPTVGTLLLIGSAALAESLAQAGLIDEYILLVQPYVMGGGRRFFSDAMKGPLELKEVKQLDQGMLHLRYSVAKDFPAS